MRKVLAIAAMLAASLGATVVAAPAHAAHAKPEDTSWYCKVC